MKPTEITMQIVKNLGNYETCRLEATFTLDDGDDLTNAFVMARKELEQAYVKAYATAYKKDDDLKNDNRKVLGFYSKEFDRVCKALYEQKTNIKELEKFFVIPQEVIKYFIDNKLT